MDSYDGDMEFVKSLADKYKNKTITKKDIYSLAGAMLLLVGAVFYQTVNALTLQFEKNKLERALAQYSKPAENQSPVSDLPPSYITQNVSFDFMKKMPELNVSYIDLYNKTCNVAEIELPPTFSQGSDNLEACIPSKEVKFGNSIYSLDGSNVIDI